MLLVAVHCSFMALTALLLASTHDSWINLLVYNSTAVTHGQLWRLVTYAFISPPSIWFALEMLMLYYFGSIVEKNIGYKNFAWFYSGLLLMGSGILQLVSLTGTPQGTSGAQAINFAVFAAFIAIYPGAQFFFGLSGRWMLLALLAIGSLQLIAGHEFVQMLVFLASTVAALFFMKQKGFGEFFGGLPHFSFSNIFRRPSTTTTSKAILKQPSPNASTLLGTLSTTTSFVVAASKSSPTKTSKATKPAIVNIDALLEKISVDGLESLTDEEKEQLEKARTALLQRDQTA